MDANLITGLLAVAAPVVIVLLFALDAWRKRRAAAREHAPRIPHDEAERLRSRAASQIDESGAGF